MQKSLKGYRTKRKLADTLKELLNTKPLEKIRIHELTERCDIHRQTFYYHFVDVYALFTWCARQDAETISARLARFSSWQEALDDLLGYIAENRGYFTAILQHMPPADKQAFFDALLAAVLEKIRCARSVGHEDTAVSQVYLQSLSIMFVTLLEKWIQEDIDQSAADIILFLEKLSDAKAPA